MKIQYLLFAALLLVTACEHPEKVAIENQIENTYFKLTNGTLADADNSPLYNTNLGTTLAMALGPINGILGGDISFEAQNIEVLELEEKTAEVTYEVVMNADGEVERRKPVAMTLKKIGGEWKLDGKKFLPLF